jgi:hypothetical protein
LRERGCGLRRGYGLAVTARIPEGQGEGDEEQRDGEFSPRKLGGQARGWGIGLRRKIFRAAIFLVTSFLVTIFFVTIFASARPLATIVCLKRSAAMIADAIAGIAGQVVALRIITMEIAGKVAEIRRKSARLDLVLAHRSEVVGYGFFLVESHLAGICAHETLVKDAAGKPVEVFFFKGAQHPDADFGGIGDGIERDTLPLALLAKFFSECTQGQLRGGLVSVRRIIIGEGESGCQKGLGDRGYRGVRKEPKRAKQRGTGFHGVNQEDGWFGVHRSFFATPTTAVSFAGRW